MITENDSQPDALGLCEVWMKDILSRNEQKFSELPIGNLRNILSTTIQQMLNAFGSGDSEKLKHFSHEVRNAVYANHSVMAKVDLLPAQQILAIKVLGIMDVVEAYLNQPNASSALSALMGKKAEGRRRVFLHMAREDRKYTREELEKPLKQRKATINGNLNSLLALGLVRSEMRDGRTFLYELSWHGRALAKEVREQGVFNDDSAKIKELQAEIELKDALIARLKAFRNGPRGLRFRIKSAREKKHAT